jgi:hypothetical protein
VLLEVRRRLLLWVLMFVFVVREVEVGGRGLKGEGGCGDVRCVQTRAIDCWHPVRDHMRPHAIAQ